MTINLRGISPEQFSKFLYIKSQKPHSCCHWLSQRIQVTWQRICFLFSHHEYIRATSLAKRVIHYAKNEKRTLDELDKVTPAFMQACLHIDSKKVRRQLVIEFAGYKEAAKTREEKASPKNGPTPTQQDIITSEENTEPGGERQTGIVWEPSQEDISTTEPFTIGDTQETLEGEVLSEEEAEQTLERESENDNASSEAFSDHPQEGISEITSVEETEETSDEEAPLDDEANQTLEQEFENDDATPSDHPQVDISDIITEAIQETFEEGVLSEEEANQALEQALKDKDEITEAFLDYIQKATILALPSQYIPSIETLQQLHSRCQFKTVIFSCEQLMTPETFAVVCQKKLESVQFLSIKAFLSLPLLPLGNEKIKEFINIISFKEKLLISAITHINHYTDFQQDLLQLQKVFCFFEAKRLVEIVLKRIDQAEHANALRALLLIYTSNTDFSSDQKVQAIFQFVNVELIREVIQILEKASPRPRVLIPLLSYYFIKNFSSIENEKALESGKAFLEDTIKKLNKVVIYQGSFFIRIISISTEFNADHSNCLMEFFKNGPESIHQDVHGMSVSSNTEYIVKIIHNVLILRPEHLPFVVESYIKHFSEDNERFITILEASLASLNRMHGLKIRTDNIKAFLKAFPQKNGLRKQICNLLQQRYSSGKGFSDISAPEAEKIIQEVLST